jgi:hypothetical protein
MPFVELTAYGDYWRGIFNGAGGDFHFIIERDDLEGIYHAQVLDAREAISFTAPSLHEVRDGLGRAIEDFEDRYEMSGLSPHRFDGTSLGNTAHLAILGGRDPASIAAYLRYGPDKGFLEALACLFSPDETDAVRAAIVWNENKTRPDINWKNERRKLDRDLTARMMLITKSRSSSWIDPASKINDDLLPAITRETGMPDWTIRKLKSEMTKTAKPLVKSDNWK